jgi:hypothetical protein
MADDIAKGKTARNDFCRLLSGVNKSTSFVNKKNYFYSFLSRNNENPKDIIYLCTHFKSSLHPYPYISCKVMRCTQTKNQ